MVGDGLGGVRFKLKARGEAAKGGGGRASVLCAS